MKVDHLAIIGLGSIGRRHLRLLRECRPELEITLVRSGKGRDWPEALVHRNVTSVADAIDLGIQAAIISSPASLHLEQASELAHAGVHLLTEKPLSVDLTGLQELQHVVKESGIVFLVGYVLRHDPAASFFRRRLLEGSLGQLLQVQIECGSYLPEWRPEQDYRETASARSKFGGGVLLELSHEIDYALWFFGPMKEVQGRLHSSGTLEIDVEDIAQMLLLSSDSVPITVNLDFNRRHVCRRCVVQGTKGELSWNAVEGEVAWRLADGSVESCLFPPSRDDLFRNQLKHFLECIEQGTPSVVSLSDGINTMRIVEAVRRSSATGSLITL